MPFFGGGSAALPATLVPFANAGANAAGARRPTVAILGDSYGQYLGAAIQWACAKYYPADIDYGGRGFWVGGTSSAYMLQTELPNFLANPADIVFIWTCKNSAPNSLATAQSEFANVKGTVDAILAAGASLVVVMGFGATGGSATGAAIEALNAYMRLYARATPRVVFVDTQALLLDIANATTTAQPFRGTNGAYQAASFDGTHPSGYAVRELAKLIAPILQRVAKRRMPRVNGARTGDFSPSTAPDINLFGDRGLVLGTPGSNTTGSGWSIQAATNGAVATPSIILGTDGFQRQRIALSGTMTADGYVYVQLDANNTGAINGGNAARLYDFEVMVDFTGVTGLCGIKMDNIGQALIEPNNTTNADRFPDNYSDTGIFLYQLGAVTQTGTSPQSRIVFYFKSGQTLSGTIDLYRASGQRVAP